MVSQNESVNILSKKIRNGCDFCIIVRDEQAKKAIPEAFSNCVILTLQESKGLEFENVLLFNHFTGNDADKGWRYIYTRTAIDEQRFSSDLKRDYETETDMYRRSKLEFRKLMKEGQEVYTEFSTKAALDQIST